MDQPAIGVVMLETRFPRPLGDIGNPATFPFPVLYATVPAARAARVVTRAPLDEALLEPFVAAARGLIDRGAAAITTSCGFLAPVQAVLAARLPVPVAASSLLLVPEVQAGLAPGRRVGVITIDATALGPAHLIAAGAPADTPIAGVEGGRELHRVVMGDLPELDLEAARADVLAAGEALRARVPDLGAVVLECTNMPPYARALEARLGVPVHDVVTLVQRLHAGLRRGAGTGRQEGRAW